MNVYPNKYKPIKKPNRSPVSGSSLVVVVWIYAAVLVLYFADEIRLSLDNQNHPLAKDIAALLLEASNILPLSQAKNQINDAAQYLYQQEYRFGTNLEPPPQEPLVQTEEYDIDYPDVGPPLPEELPTIDRQPPQKILLVGASSMHSRMGAELSKGLNKLTGFSIQRHAKLGTGLARPDVYDWKEVTLELVEKYNSDLVVAQFIGNDCQSLIHSDRSLEVKYGEPLWDQAYQQRIIDFIDMLRSRDIEVVLVGMPIVRSPRFRTKIEHVNALVQETALANDAHFISLWDASTNNDGSFKAFVRKNGRTLPFRHEDGIHLSVEGAKQIATTIVDHLQKIYRWDEKKLKEPRE